MFFQDAFNFFLAWLSGRKWGRVVAALLLPMTAFLAVCTVNLLAWTRDDSQLVDRYLSMASKELGGEEEGDTNSDGENIWESSKELDVDTGLLLRRVLQLEEYNSRATYLVAQDLLRSGRLSTGKQMLRGIAPRERVGYPPAHALLAALGEQKKRGLGLDVREQETLRYDLEAAMEWPEVTPDLVVMLASILEEGGDLRAAIGLLKEKAEEHPELLMVISEFARANNDPVEAEIARSKSKDQLLDRIKQQDAEPLDFLRLSEIYLKENQGTQAIQTASAGLQVLNRDLAVEKLGAEARESLGRAFSRQISLGYYLLFNDSIEQLEGGGTRMNLDLLDRAMRADPTNPPVMNAVFDLMLQGGNASGRLVESLQKSLADGTASTLTHMLLANRHLREGMHEKALPHLRMALTKSKRNPTLLNNLAFALMQGSEADQNEALEHIDSALRIVQGMQNSDRKNVASMLDTKGQVLEKLGRINDAIVCYEDAIRAQDDKLNTRQRLAAAYRKVGLEEMANTQLKKIESIKNR
ncbi:MAG: hypothetical protein ACE361_20685 [Aureliella sp.]